MDSPGICETPAIRVAMPHPALAKYRVPVFREMARREGVRLKVLYGRVPNLPNVEPDGFDAEYAHIWQGRFVGHPVYWQWAQWRWARPDFADVLVLDWDVHYLSLVPTLLRAQANGLGTVLWGHGYSKHEAAWRKWVRNNVGRLGTCLLFYNHTAAQGCIDAGWDPQRVYVALNSLDQEPIQAARKHWLGEPEAIAQFQREQGLTPGPVVLFVSRLEVDNRVDLLLESTRRLVGRHPHLKVVIVGKGPDQDRLKAIAESLELGEHVKFTGAIYDDMTLAPWALSARAFCYPANIGLSILHALGYGLPVVTSDLVESQNPEIEALRHGENGLLYRHGDVDALTEALNQLLEDEALSQRMSAAALRTVTERFTLSNMVDGLVAAVQYAYQHSARYAAASRAG